MAQTSCIFCGGIPVTREHLFSECVGKLMSSSITPRPGYRAVMMNERGKDNVITKRWQTKIPAIVARCVCGPCNNNWMGQIEDTVIPTLTEMIEGRTTVLDVKAQTAVATWLSLKAIIEQHARNEPPPERWGREFYDKRRPPPAWQVRIGEYGGTSWAGRVTGTSIDVFGPHPLVPVPGFRLKFPGFLSTIHLGHFIGQVVGLDRPAELGTNRLHWLQIWPHPLLRANIGSVGTGSNPVIETWPPSRGLDDSRLARCTTDVQEPRLEFVAPQR